MIEYDVLRQKSLTLSKNISLHTYFSRFTTKAVVAWCEIRLNKNWINPRKTVKRIIEILTMFTEIYIYRVLK